MALVVKDRVQETSTTTGTGTFTLAGAVSGFQSFSAIGNGNTTYYAIVLGSEWEVGLGTYTSSGTVLSRDTILESSNGGTAVNFSAGTKNVFVTYPAEKGLYTDASGNAIALGTPASATLTNATGLPISTGVSGLGTGVATFLATPSSANLASAVTDETGSGSLVFGTSPTIASPTFTSQATFAAGTAAAPAITTTGDTNTGIFFPAADTIAFAEGGTEAMRLDSSGNVGIGATTLLNPGSPDAKTLTVSATKYPQIFSIATTATANNTTYRTIVRDTGVYQIQLINDAGTSEQTAYEISRTANSVTYQRWFGGTTEAMRIASDGIVTISKGVSGTPAFAAYQSTGVALTAATWTKITFQTEEYDTNSNFASSRFTPTVAGYYQINGAWQFGSGGTVTGCAIYKNGTIHKQGANTGGTAGYGGSVSSLVYFNGSSDYVELYGYASSAKTPLATIDATYFNGALVRGA